MHSSTNHMMHTYCTITYSLSSFSIDLETSKCQVIVFVHFYPERARKKTSKNNVKGSFTFPVGGKQNAISSPYFSSVL